MRIFSVLLLTLAAGVASAQSFEVASVRPGDPGSKDQNLHVDDGIVIARSFPLRNLLEWAYGVKPLQIVGPAWLSDARFDINARAGHTVTGDETRLMVQSLLAERFGLKLHHEQKEQQVYSLTLAKNGPRLHDSSAKDGSKLLVSTTEGSSNFHEEKTGAMAERATMAEFGDKFSRLLDRIVIDRTGLTARYDLRIDLTPYLTEAADGKEGVKPDIMSILFRGITEQLGLKLEPHKEMVDVIVIDAVNRTPGEN